MRTKTMQIMIAALLFGCVIGIGSGEVWAQVVETPTETPVETPTATPVESPTATPVVVPTDTPVPPTATPTQGETSVETPTETPAATATPVPPTPTPTDVPPTPTATPVESPVETPTETPVEQIQLSISGPASLNVGDSGVYSIEIQNAADVDAFGLDVLQSNAALEFTGVDIAGTLTQDFFGVDGSALAAPAGAVRIGAIGGPSSVNGDGVLLNILYTATSAGNTILSLANVLDDLQGAELATLAIVVEEETAVETPTPTEVPPTPTETEAVTPTPTETEAVTPTPTETEAVTPTPTETEAITPTPTEVSTPTPTLSPEEPTLTPTALEINPVLGLVSLDELGGTYPRGNAVHNFDIGTSNKLGQLAAPGVLDGKIDPDALGPFLFIDGQPIPIAKDMEFSGQIAENGNGSEGAYFLIGGSIGTVPPVSGRLGATGGPNNGGIDIDNNAANNINFIQFKSDIIPVLYIATDENPNGEFISPLVDIEPAGNGGFYVLADDGKIYAEGDALESLDTGSPVAITDGASAVALKIWRGKQIDVSNSQYSSDLIGTGAYILDSAGVIHTVGTAPALDTSNLPVVPANPRTGIIQDLEFIPNAEGTEWIGVGILMGDGKIAMAPFTGDTITGEYANSIAPFNNLPEGFPINIARDFEIMVSDSPIYGLGESGQTVESTGRRVGIMVFDGFGGTHTGGRITRYAPSYIPAGSSVAGKKVYTINGQRAVSMPVTPPYTFNIDTNQDVEIAPPVQR